MYYKLSEWNSLKQRLKRFYNIDDGYIKQVESFMKSIPDNYGEITFTQEGKSATFREIKDFDKYIKKVVL